ncbi:hypothetical protein H072_8271 [Dactylellina haptotyla CBS 200.50]|uniref:BZIP domain-containing protein n=1 Tax=Dactylellina haptotyla (strain CBS 200.50) TaxID=1284197 RepID=S8AAA6_DACHA|nr:hypothetical protein H072_8271 [Dactylellina haptotyla CBS 200.50]
MSAQNKVSKRKSPVPVPDVAGASDERLDHIEDPAERKRVLNVLAQRRYRKRKREHQLELQMQVERQKHHTGITPGKELSPTDWEPIPSDRSDNARELAYLRRRVMELEAALYAKSLDTQSAVSLTSPSEVFDAFGNPTVVEHALSASSESDPGAFGSEVLENWMLAQASGPQEVPSSSSVPTQPLPDIGDFLQSFTSTSFNFPDEANLSIPAFSLLRACTMIAQRLKVSHLLWDFTATSPFYGSTSIQHHELPADIRPTATQLTVPHHPMLDLLPWPKVRDRLITTFNMDQSMWPVYESERLDLLRLIYDMENSEEDGCEGVRVNGTNAFDGSGWEVGQKFFTIWWWALDRDVIGRSNYWRSQRGDPKLTLGSDEKTLGEKGFSTST